MGESAKETERKTLSPSLHCLVSRLVPIQIDLHLKKNHEAHSTIFYDLPGLLLRRGEPFTLSFDFNQDADRTRSDLALIFQAETWSNVPPVKVPLNDGNTNGWSTKRILSTPEEQKKDEPLTLQIHSPSTIPIGKYSVSGRERKIR